MVSKINRATYCRCQPAISHVVYTLVSLFRVGSRFFASRRPRMSRQEKRSCRNMPWVSADMLLEQSELYRSKMSSGSAFFSLQSQSETLGCRNAMVKQKHRWTWGFITETFQTFLVICTWQAMEEKRFDMKCRNLRNTSRPRCCLFGFV